MSNGFSRQKIGKQHLKRKPKCACCPEPAIHHLTWKNGWFRGDDDDELTCDKHLSLAKDKPKEFWALVAQCKAYLDAVIEAQHEETGREWRGTRRTLPPRYVELSQEGKQK